MMRLICNGFYFLGILGFITASIKSFTFLFVEKNADKKEILYKETVIEILFSILSCVIAITIAVLQKFSIIIF